MCLLVYFLLNNCTIDVQGDDPRREMHPVVTAIFGATAGAASVFGNTPLDVVKTRMQVSIRLHAPEDNLSYHRSYCGGLMLTRCVFSVGLGSS
jgi:hypothetical protein